MGKSLKPPRTRNGLSKYGRRHRGHRVDRDFWPFHLGRTLASASPDHVYRATSFSIGSRTARNGSRSSGWFHAHHSHVTYEFKKFGHRSFSVDFHIGRLDLHFGQDWRLGSRDV